MKKAKTMKLVLGATALFGLMACNISSSVPVGGSNGSGLVVSFTDTTQLTILFDNATRTRFDDTALFDLADIRQKLRDNDMDSSQMSITALAVSFDNNTRSFLQANLGVNYVFRIFTRDPNTTTAPKLTLESLANPALSFDPVNPPMVLRDQLFASPAGFSDLITSIQGTSASLQAIAELTLSPALADTGTAYVTLVITVSGKKKI